MTLEKNELSIADSCALLARKTYDSEIRIVVSHGAVGHPETLLQPALRFRCRLGGVVVPVAKTHQENVDEVVAVNFAIHVSFREAEVAHSAKPDPEHVIAHSEFNRRRFRRILGGTVLSIARVAKRVGMRRCVYNERAVRDVFEQATECVAGEVSVHTTSNSVLAHLRCRGLLGEGAQRRLEWCRHRFNKCLQQSTHGHSQAGNERLVVVQRADVGSVRALSERERDYV